MPSILGEEKVGNFRILEKIGEGGMAIIYKAIQPALKRTVVIKKLKDPNKEIVERFKKEALVSASFSQENVLAIYDFIYQSRYYYLVMEYVDGKDLRTIIDYFAPLPLHIAALIIREIAKGLEYTHTKGITHRDIKPSNILISFQGDVKLIDFGVAKDEAPSKLTMTGMIVGTPSYMSPEQANGEKINNQSDLYSLGVLLYELITGIKPFTGDTNTEVMMKIIKGKYASPRKYNPEIPLKLARIVKKCLQKTRKRRYQNAQELIRDLNNYIPWQGQTHKKDLLSDFLKRFDNLEDHFISSSATASFSVKKNLVFKMAATLIIVIGIYTSIQTGRYVLTKRLLTLDVNVNRTGAIVYLDEQYLGKMNTHSHKFFNIPGGHHIITVTNAANDAVYRYRTFLEPGHTKEISAKLPEMTNGVEITINSDPIQSSINLDGSPVGRTPLNGITVDRGNHLIHIQKEGYHPITETISINKYSHYSLQYTLDKID